MLIVGQNKSKISVAHFLEKSIILIVQIVHLIKMIFSVTTIPETSFLVALFLHSPHTVWLWTRSWEAVCCWLRNTSWLHSVHSHKPLPCWWLKTFWMFVRGHREGQRWICSRVPPTISLSGWELLLFLDSKPLVLRQVYADRSKTILNTWVVSSHFVLSHFHIFFGFLNWAPLPSWKVAVLYSSRFHWDCSFNNTHF